MSKEKKFVRKSFWIHQFEKEEQFLTDMREKGWKFVALHKGIPTKYEFEACEPEKYSYCLDYIKVEEDTEDYHQLYKDAGWEEVMEWPGFNAKWVYFCKKSVDGEKEVIFTDPASKIGLLNKLFLTYGLFFIVMLLPQMNNISLVIRLIEHKERYTWLYLLVPITVLAILILLWLAYMGIRVAMMKSKLKKQVTEKI